MGKLAVKGLNKLWWSLVHVENELRGNIEFLDLHNTIIQVDQFCFLTCIFSFPVVATRLLKPILRKRLSNFKIFLFYSLLSSTIAWTTAIAMENVDYTPCIVKPISIFSLFRQFFCLKVMVVHAAKWLLFSQEISLFYRQVSSGVYTFLRNSRTVLSFKLGNFNLNLIRPRCSQFRLYFPTT